MLIQYFFFFFYILFLVLNQNSSYERLLASVYPYAIL